MENNFDDARLIRMAKAYWYGATEVPYKDLSLEGFFRKEKLTNDERNRLLSFIEESKPIKQKSMVEMKRELLSLVGAKESNSYSNTIGRDELKVIYDYVKSIVKT